jgi:hypothetical protein
MGISRGMDLLGRYAFENKEAEPLPESKIDFLTRLEGRPMMPPFHSHRKSGVAGSPRSANFSSAAEDAVARGEDPVRIELLLAQLEEGIAGAEGNTEHLRRRMDFGRR